MAERLSLDDFAGHVGCRHVLEPDVQNHIRTWFTTPIGGTSPFVRLRDYLDINRPIPGGWTAAKVKRAVMSFIADEPEA